MSGEFTGKDLGKELSRLRSTNAPFDVLVSGARGVHLVSQILDAVYKTFNTDPDAVFYLMSLSAKRLTKLSERLVLRLNELVEILPLAVEEPVLPSAVNLGGAIAKLDELIASPGVKADSLIKAYNEEVTSFLNSAKTGAGKSAKKKSPEDAREEVMSLTEEIRDIYVELLYTSRRVMSALTRYEETDLRKNSLDQQARTIKLRLAKIIEAGGEDNLNKAFLTASVGSGLLGSRANRRSVLADKYSGEYTFVPGEAPYLEGNITWNSSANAISHEFTIQPGGATDLLGMVGAKKPEFVVPIKMVTHAPEALPLIANFVPKDNFKTYYAESPSPAVGTGNQDTVYVGSHGDFTEMQYFPVAPGTFIATAVDAGGVTRIIRDTEGGDFLGDVGNMASLNYTDGSVQIKFSVPIPVGNPVYFHYAVPGRRLTGLDRAFAVNYRNEIYTYHVSEDPIYDPAGLVTAVQAAVGEVFTVSHEQSVSIIAGVTTTSHSMRAQGDAAGRNARIGFPQMNSGLGHIYGFVKTSAVGEDVTSGQIQYLENMSSPVSPSETPKVTIEESAVATGRATAELVTQNKLVPTSEVLALIEVGDTVITDNARYRVYAKMASHAILTESILRPLTNTGAVVGNYTFTFSVSRDVIRISTGSSAVDSTVTVVTPGEFGGLGFADIGTTAKAQSTVIDLAGTVTGSPVRPGDKIYSLSDTLVATVTSVSGSLISTDTSLSASSEGGSVKITSRGLAGYRELSADRLAAARALATVSDATEIQNLAAMYINSHTNYNRLTLEIQSYYSVAVAVSSAYATYEANVCSAANVLLAGLREEKLERVREILLALRFDILTNINAAGVSNKTELDLLVESASTFFDPGYEVLTPVPERSTLMDYADEPGVLLDKTPPSDPR